ncbi:uncharacterized protein KNAG_0D05270 [Huiozyma naganishii CBS 8797]|uniref:Uncharacterized protein n=1 Tax=Huiozyma naganishii (strain ATCC MYA-139 / BCRC 22969 / CBS 8797 / KCTC 17520 / NBRC 10181 / NCYC 3082 / Yp74L-3) TaxID=1071383 RepID=J7R5X6_HUIN7|nr:hypothetical protein KNAG_0D05270 [Kazachstania naganishii CBS 8797]CCK70265.1 hypothetical protein KNAG_0D05270 [Kazachstania naganishii CBS 8797]
MEDTAGDFPPVRKSKLTVDYNAIIKDVRNDHDQMLQTRSISLIPHSKAQNDEGKQIGEEGSIGPPLAEMSQRALSSLQENIGREMSMSSGGEVAGVVTGKNPKRVPSPHIFASELVPASKLRNPMKSTAELTQQFWKDLENISVRKSGLPDEFINSSDILRKVAVWIEKSVQSVLEKSDCARTPSIHRSLIQNDGNLYENNCLSDCLLQSVLNRYEEKSSAVRFIYVTLEVEELQQHAMLRQHILRQVVNQLHITDEGMITKLISSHDSDLKLLIGLTNTIDFSDFIENKEREEGLGKIKSVLVFKVRYSANEGLFDGRILSAIGIVQALQACMKFSKPVITFFIIRRARSVVLEHRPSLDDSIFIPSLFEESISFRVYRNKVFQSLKITKAGNPDNIYVDFWNKNMITALQDNKEKCKVSEMIESSYTNKQSILRCKENILTTILDLAEFGSLLFLFNPQQPTFG